MHALVVGSSVIDLFMNVDPDHFTLSDKHVTLTLGDKVPSEIKKITLGGNGANVSVGLTRLEIPTSFYTYLGNDILSREIEEGLTREGVELAVDKNREGSSALSLIFAFRQDRIIFSHHEVRDYTFSFDKDEKFDPDLIGVDFMYLTSIGKRWERAYEQILEFAQKNNIPIAFSPGAHQIESINDKVREIIASSKIFFSNKEETEAILGKNAGSDIKELLTLMKNKGPEIVSITDGATGAYAVDRDGIMYFIKPSPAEGHDKTGAGDAYATGFFASVLHGNNVPTSMLWGALNSGGVIKKMGAQNGLLTKKELDGEAKSKDAQTAEKI